MNGCEAPGKVRPKCIGPAIYEASGYHVIFPLEAFPGQLHTGANKRCHAGYDGTAYKLLASLDIVGRVLLSPEDTT